MGCATGRSLCNMHDAQRRRRGAPELYKRHVSAYVPSETNTLCDVKS